MEKKIVSSVKKYADIIDVSKFSFENQDWKKITLMKLELSASLFNKENWQNDVFNLTEKKVQEMFNMSIDNFIELFKDWEIGNIVFHINNETYLQIND